MSTERKLRKKLAEEVIGGDAADRLKAQYNRAMSHWGSKVVKLQDGADSSGSGSDDDSEGDDASDNAQKHFIDCRA